MPGIAGQLAMQAGSQALGTIFGLGLEKHQDERQYRQQQKLTGLQIGAQKQLTDYNYGKQMQLWNETNYKAQMEQLRKAGLNPGLLYGMSGGGGATTNIAQGSVGGSHAPAGGQEIQTMMGMGLQSAMMAAQIENIKADTQNKVATTPKIQTETASLAQGIKNQKAVERLTNVQTEIAQVEASVSRQTIKEQMQAWENIAEKGTQEITALKLQNALSEQQFNDKITDLKGQIAERSIRMALMDAQKNNTNQDTKNKIQEIIESEQRIKTMAGHLILQWSKMDREGAQPSPEGANDDWNFIKDLVPGFLIPIGNGFKKGHTPVQGFKK